MMFSPLTLVLVVANVLGAAMAVPQAAKLVRTRRTQGVSITWAVISAAVNGGWAVYGIGVGDFGIVPVSVVSVLSYLVIATILVRAAPERSWRRLLPAAVAALAVTAVAVLAGALGGWPAAGIALGGLYGVQLSPAVVAIYRAVDVAGVSVSTWVIAFMEAVLWGVYGLVRVDTGIVTLAVTGVLMSSLVLARLVVKRPRRSRLHVLVPAFAAA